MTTLDAYTSANHQKYASGGRFYRWQLGRFLRKLHAMTAATAPRTVLDAGCGEGFVTGYLKKRSRAWQITGVDLSASAIAYAKAHFGHAVDFRTGSLYDLPFDDGAFDTVVCSEVLEHLDEPARAAQELRRVARRGVVLSVPREPYFEALVRLGRLLGRSPDPGHVNHWTRRGFRRFVERHFGEAAFEAVHIYQLACARL